MPTIPEFILRKMFVSSSLFLTPRGLDFVLLDTYAPATLVGFGLEIDGAPIPTAQITLQVEGSPARPVDGITPLNPFPLPLNTRVQVSVSGISTRPTLLRLSPLTREAGELPFTVRPGAVEAAPAANEKDPFRRPLLFNRSYAADLRVDAQQVIGAIDRRIYGQFVEHLEDCVYNGIWSQDGSQLQAEVVRLAAGLRPPLIRYPGGNFASGYHWQDGIGPKETRAQRFDQAWNTIESNQVGTDEFMRFCEACGAEPFLVVNDATGTPEEAAAWVAYCNEPAEGPQGRRRAANGHPQPYNVRLWGVGNEVWGPWQIGHTDASGYAGRLRPIVEAMRAVNSHLEIVAVGSGLLSAEPSTPAYEWNEMVLGLAGDCFEHLSFHVYNPESEGYRETYDALQLFHTLCAAPLSVEVMLQRFAQQIAQTLPDRAVGVALDEWNLFMPPAPGATSMHDQRYTQRDALYIAGMLNVFQRQCQTLKIANLAQLVNVLPLIVAQGGRAFATPLYYPFQMYSLMESIALQPQVDGPTYASEPLGNITAFPAVPYLDASATRSPDGSRLVLGLVNRHPTRQAKLSASLAGFPPLRPGQGWLLASPHPLSLNSFDQPGLVSSRPFTPPALAAAQLKLTLPPASVAVLEYRV